MRICTVEIREMVNNFYAWDVLKSHNHQAHLTHLCLVSPFQPTSLPENYHRSIILDLFRQSDTLSSILYSYVCHSKKLPSLFCSIMQCHLYAAYSLCVCFVNFAIHFPCFLSLYIYEYMNIISLYICCYCPTVHGSNALELYFLFLFATHFVCCFGCCSMVFHGFSTFIMCVCACGIFTCLFAYSTFIYLARAYVCLCLFALLST